MHWVRCIVKSVQVRQVVAQQLRLIKWQVHIQHLAADAEPTSKHQQIIVSQLGCESAKH
jgi:hypothetical protein